MRFNPAKRYGNFMIHGEQDPAQKAPTDPATGYVPGVQSYLKVLRD
jgi:hypothetical protein